MDLDAMALLCEEFDVGRKEILTSERQQQVDMIIRQASKAIMKLVNQGESEDDLCDNRILHRIVQNLNQAKVVTSNFGANVVALIEKFGLPDAKIIEEYYRKNPRLDKKRWVSVIPYYRGIVMHRSYFDFEKKHDIDDVIIVLCHLHDILIRIIFIILGYKGNYQPPVIDDTTSVAFDWVKSDTPATRLGYIEAG